MFIDKWTSGQNLGTSDWVTVYQYDQPGDKVWWYGCVFHLDSPKVLLRITGNGIVMVDVDLDELNDSNRFNLSIDSPRWLRPYAQNRWALELPHPLEYDRLKGEMKGVGAQRQLVRAFSTRMLVGG